MIKQLHLCGLYQYQLMTVSTRDLQLKMVWAPLIATWWVYRLLQAVTLCSRHCGKNTIARSQNLLLGAPTLKSCPQIAFKGTPNNGQDLLTSRKDSWAESKDLKAFYRQINFQGLKWTLENLCYSHPVNRKGSYIRYLQTRNN